MTYEKSDKQGNLPFGLYYPDYGYLTFLKATGYKIPDDEPRFYCGPVYSEICEEGHIDYFAFVNRACLKEYEIVPLDLVEGKLGLGLVDFNIMIPIPLTERYFIRRDTSDMELDKYIIDIKSRITECADYVMSVQRGLIDESNVKINDNTLYAVNIKYISRGYIVELKVKGFNAIEAVYTMR